MNPIEMSLSIFWPMRGFVETLLDRHVLDISPLMYRHAIRSTACLSSTTSLSCRNTMHRTTGLRY